MAQQMVVKTLRFLGFHVSFDKLICPSTSVTYLGIIIDSARMELRLPEGKLVKNNAKFIKLSDNVLADLVWWKKLCRFFNGSNKIGQESNPLPLVSDSSFGGFGAYFGEDWVAGVWHDEDSIPLVSSCNHVAFRPIYDLSTYDNINELVAHRDWFKKIGMSI